jgi:purine-binding chemotaxis protein CheW
MNTATLAATAAQPSAAAPQAASPPTQYLTFSLASETFAIGILAIKEIIEYRGITGVPMTPPCVRGVINLRGAVVPVVDLQARFGKPSSPVGKRTCIVIVETVLQGQAHIIGVVVDAVSEVLDIPDSDIEPPPSFGARIGREFIAGMGKVRGKFVILLDVGNVLSLDEIGALEPVASQPALQPGEPPAA